MNENSIENSTPSRTARSASSMAIPAAIVLGFGLIALSIYFSGGSSPAAVTANSPEKATADLSKIDPITEADHIRGNPNAPLVIVEYSDFDCPFCQNFHGTMKKIMDEYGPSGDVAWVYRNMPLTSLHPSAMHLAEAGECVAELGGNDAFWKFADMVFGERAQNEPTNIARLPEFAESAGVDKAAFESCVDSARHQADIDADTQNAIAIGAEGTPYSVLIAGNQKMVINGAQPYEWVKSLIDSLR